MFKKTRDNHGRTMRPVWTLRLSAAVLAGVLAFASVPASATSTKTLTLAVANAVNSLQHQVANVLGDIVSEKTNGELKIRVVAGGALGSNAQNLDQLDAGALDMSMAGFVFMGKWWKPTETIALPFLFSDWDHVNRATQGQYGDLLKEGVAANSNFIILGMHVEGFRDMIFKDGVKTRPEEVVGLRMRAPESPPWINMYNALGAKPTPIPWVDLYTALSTGVVEGMDAPPAAIEGAKFYEVLKFLSKTHHMVNINGFAISKRAFESLPRDQQIALLEAGRETTIIGNQMGVDAETEAYGLLRSHGVTISDLKDISAWREKMAPVTAAAEGDHPDIPRLFKAIEASRY